MNIDSNSKCVRSKYFTRQTDMDESLSDFQEVKKSCKGPKPAQKPAKPKSRKVTKRIKGQNDIRTALKGKKNELVAYSKEFDTVCKKSGLDVDPEQLQLAIALSKSLQTESNTPETSQASTSQQRVAKIRKTLQEYGFKVPEAKISAGKKPKKYRKQYKLLTVTEEEKHQNITGKYTRILFENLDQSKVEQDSSNSQESDARIFYIASNIPYECIKDNIFFYVGDLVEKSTTSGSLLRDWSEIPGRPESPKLIDTYAMNFKDIDCSQDELDTILSGPIKSVKDIFASKEIEYKRKYEDCNVPKIVIEDEEKMSTEDNGSKMDKDIDGIVPDSGLIENKSSLQNPDKVITESKSPVKILLEDKTLVTEDIELISPINKANNTSKEVISTEAGNKQYRSCSPDIFDDELSSVMETSKPIVVLSQEHKTKVFSQDNYMDLTECANIPSQNSERGILLSQNVTKRRSNDFMEITDCIVGSSQHMCEEWKEIDLTQSPEDNGAIVDSDMNVGDNVSKNATDSISQNITDEQQITILSNHPNTDSHQADKENIDLTQSSNEDDDSRTNIEMNVQIPGKKVEESMDLTQSSNSTDVSLPLVDVGNSQTQASLDDTIIVDKQEYIAKIKKSCLLSEASSQVYDLTQVQDTSIEYHPSPVKIGSEELCSNSFYEDFVHEHSTNTENSKELEQNSDLNERSASYNESKETNDDIDLTQGSSSSEDIAVSQRPITAFEKVPNNSSLGKQDDVSIDYDEIIIEDNIDDKESSRNERVVNLTQQYDLSEVNNDLEIENNDRDINLIQKSELGSQISDKALEYALHESRLIVPKDKESGKHNLTQQYDSSKVEGDNDVEILDDNGDDINSSQNSGVFQIFDKELDYSLHKSRRDLSINSSDNEEDKNMDLKYDSSKSEVNNDIEIVDDNNDADMHSSQNSEVFQISDKELDYSLHKSRRDFLGDNFEFGGISVLDNLTKLESCRKSLSEGCQPYFNENKNDTEEDSFLPEVYVKKTENKIVETTQLEAEGMSPIKIQEVLKSNNGILNIKTPKNSEYIIKTVDVTPMADFASMSTPQRNRELDRYGLKPFKRKRAIQILTHLYNQTHPTIQQLADEDLPSPSKKPRTNTYTQDSPLKRSVSSPGNSSSKMATDSSKSPVTSPLKFTWKKPMKETTLHASPKKTDMLDRDSHISSAMSSKSTDVLEKKTPVKSPRKFVYKEPRVQALPSKTDHLESDSNISSAASSRSAKLDKERNMGSALSRILPHELERDRDIFSAPLSTNADERDADVCRYEITNEVAVLKSVDCCPDDWVFQKREKAKIHSCRVPLHIAFHNYVLSRRSLREAILKYEPVNIDVIHKDLVGYGHRYDPKDLLRFLDKRCITVKTSDNNARNNKR